jgi:hypothetical protein
VTGPAPVPAPARPRRRRQARRTGRRWPLFALLAAGLAAAGLWLAFRPDPEADLLAELRSRGFELNGGFAAHYRPGTVIRLFRRGPGGAAEALVRPEVVFWPEQCFPGRMPRSEAFALAGSAGARSFRLDAGQVHRLLPRFGIEGAKSWEMEVVRPRTAAFALLGDLSEQFSGECLARLEARLDAGEPLAGYRTVTEAVVADGLRLTIDWQAGTGGAVREAARRQVGSRLRGRVETAFASEERTVLDVRDEIVLAYRTAEMEAVGMPEAAPAP